MPRTFLKNCIMEWNSHKISDHNRRALAVDTERIGDDKRMANGMLRKYVIADKRTFSTSWEDVPHKNTYTVDGFWGGSEMENFYYDNAGAFTLKITNGDGTINTYTVVFSDFSKEISKRGKFDFWNVTVEMKEV